MIRDYVLSSLAHIELLAFGILGVYFEYETSNMKITSHCTIKAYINKQTDIKS